MQIIVTDSSCLMVLICKLLVIQQYFLPWLLLCWISLGFKKLSYMFHCDGFWSLHFKTNWYAKNSVFYFQYSFVCLALHIAILRSFLLNKLDHSLGEWRERRSINWSIRACKSCGRFGSWRNTPKLRRLWWYTWFLQSSIELPCALLSLKLKYVCVKLI